MSAGRAALCACRLCSRYGTGTRVSARVECNLVPVCRKIGSLILERSSGLIEMKGFCKTIR
eukprot:1293932-Pleurochrysis_carterae.AAC.1